MDATLHRFPVRNVCPVCNEQFTLKATLKQHIANKHPSHDHSASRKIGTDTSYYPSSETSSYSTYTSQSLVTIPFLSNGLENATNGFLTEPTDNNSKYPIQEGIPISLVSTRHSKVDEWPCNDFGKVFDSPNKLDQHQEAKLHLDKILSETSGYETDTTIKRNVEYRCNLCSKSFDVEGKLNQHNLSEGHLQRMRATNADTETVSTIDGTKSFNCKHCAKSFENESRLNQHKKSDGHRQRVKLLKSATQAEELVKMFPCNLEDCGRQFDSEVKLLQHQTMKHGAHAGVVSSDKSETDFRCSEDGCDKIFPTKSQLLQHTRDKHLVDTSEPPPVRRLCMDCDEFNETAGAKPFIFLTFIAKHIITAHEKPGYIKGTCPICGTRVEKPKNLLTHISRVHLLPRFRDTACVICLRLCKNEDDLLQHSTSVHRFKCIIDTCQSMFPSKPLRDKHMLDKHSVYGCGYENCHRIFTTLDEKIEHTKTPHEGEAGPSPITCSRGMSNIHEGGVMSEPTAFRLIKEPSPAHHSRNSADERCLRSTNNPSNLLSIHNTLGEKMEDLRAFINEFSRELSLITNEEQSVATFRKSEDLKSAIEGVQRRLTPRVD